MFEAPDITTEIQVDLQPVGHHGFNLEDLVEFCAAGLYQDSPVTRWGVGFSVQSERIESVQGFLFVYGFDKLATGISKFELDRIVVRKGRVRIQ